VRLLKRIKDIVTGKIARSNRLIGNHGVRICKKVEDVPSLINGIVVGTTMCSIEFLEEIIFEVHDLKYEDGMEEANPFKKNIERLDDKNSFEMFKLVAGNYLSRLIGEGYFDSAMDFIDVSEVKKQFFEIYEYTAKDIRIFDELVGLAKKNERPSPEFRLFGYIFERAYNIKSPETVFHIMNFELLFMKSFREVFLPGLLEVLKQAR